MRASSRFSRTLVGCVVILSAQAVLVAAAMAFGDQKPHRLWAISLAAAVTGGGALAGWLVARWSRLNSPAIAAAGGLAATACRLLPPLVTLAWLTAAEPPMAEAGLGGLLVSFYLTMLLVAIFLHIQETRGEPSGGSCKETI